MLACCGRFVRSRLVPVVGLFLSYLSAFARAGAFPGCLVLLASSCACRVLLGVLRGRPRSRSLSYPLRASVAWAVLACYRRPCPPGACSRRRYGVGSLSRCLLGLSCRLRAWSASPSLVRWPVGRFCLLRRCRVPLSPPSRFSCRAAACFVSLRYSPRPSTWWAGRCLAVVVIGCWLVACAVACRAWGGAACPHGVLSFRVVLAVGGVLC